MVVKARSRRRTDRDWLGRRYDLREYHRDPSCNTHDDPLEECTCRSIFLNADWIADWALYSTLVGALALFVWVLSSYLTSL